MKFLIMSLLTVSTQAMAAKEWKVLATVADPACPEEVQILAKEGEKFVVAQLGDQKQKLVAKDGSAFSADSMKATTFAPAASEKTTLGEPTMVFTQPGYVEGNPPKLDISYSGVQKHCRMKFNL